MLNNLDENQTILHRTVWCKRFYSVLAAFRARRADFPLDLFNTVDLVHVIVFRFIGEKLNVMLLLLMVSVYSLCPNL